MQNQITSFSATLVLAFALVLVAFSVAQLPPNPLPVAGKVAANWGREEEGERSVKLLSLRSALEFGASAYCFWYPVPASRPAQYVSNNFFGLESSAFYVVLLAYLFISFFSGRGQNPEVTLTYIS